MYYIIVIYTVRTALNFNENEFTNGLYLFVIHLLKLSIRIDNWLYVYKLQIWLKNEFEINHKFKGDVANWFKINYEIQVWLIIYLKQIINSMCNW